MKKLIRIIDIIIILICAALGYLIFSGKGFDFLKGSQPLDPELTKISIVSVKMDTKSGSPLLSIVFKNDGEETIDRFDFRLKCYDTYGDLIKHSFSDYRHFFYADSDLLPGKTTPKKTILLDSATGVKYVEIAITKLHTKSGKTIEASDSALQYQRFDIK